MQPDLLELRMLGERLRRMPQELEPPMSFEEFERRVEAPADVVLIDGWRGFVKQRPPGARRWQPAAVAATLIVAMAGLALWARLTSLGAPDELVSDSAFETPMVSIPDRQVQSEAAERWLARLPVEPAVMRVGTRLAVTDLEDRIAWMDDTLSAERLDAINQAHIAALQRERARLVNSLAQVRYAETLAAAVQ